MHIAYCKLLKVLRGLMLAIVSPRPFFIIYIYNIIYYLFDSIPACVSIERPEVKKLLASGLSTEYA